MSTSASSSLGTEGSRPTAGLSVVALAKRVNEVVARFPESFHARILRFCRQELGSAQMFDSKAQNTTHVLTSSLSLEDARRLLAFVSDLDAEFRSSSDHFIDAAIERHFRELQQG